MCWALFYVLSIQQVKKALNEVAIMYTWFSLEPGGSQRSRSDSSMVITSL